MANIQINYEMVKQTSIDLRAGKEYLEEQLGRMSGFIERLIANSGGFRTDLAAPKFHQSFGVWRNGMLRMVGGLDGMSQQLDIVVREHQQLDSNLGGAASS